MALAGNLYQSFVSPEYNRETLRACSNPIMILGLTESSQVMHSRIHGNVAMACARIDCGVGTAKPAFLVMGRI